MKRKKTRKKCNQKKPKNCTNTLDTMGGNWRGFQFSWKNKECRKT